MYVAHRHFEVNSLSASDGFDLMQCLVFFFCREDEGERELIADIFGSSDEDEEFEVIKESRTNRATTSVMCVVAL